GSGPSWGAEGPGWGGRGTARVKGGGPPPPPRPLGPLEAVNREAGPHPWRSADSIRQKPGLTGPRHIGRVVVEIENLVWRNLETRGQAAEGLRVGLAPAELRREDRPPAEDVGGGGKQPRGV